jgi:NhaA family Na+:H+ antiporter
MAIADDSRRRPLAAFLRTEAGSASLLLAAALVALAWANLAPAGSYAELWAARRVLRIGGVAFPWYPRAAVNDGLMTLFFLVVGLEIRRELTRGELRDRRAAMLPAIAALGGMLVPALLYLAVNGGTDARHGWGIPVATDIAFALGVLAVAAPRAPQGLRAFLLTLAIADDIGAIVLIALVYTGGVDLGALGVVLWGATLASGVHAAIAGVAFAFLLPVGVASSALERLEAALHPWTSRFVVPVFALANAGVRVVDADAGALLRDPVVLGVVAGLVVGKFLGISGATAIALRAGLGRLPDGVTPRDVPAVAAVAGIGFTVSLFIAELAFPEGFGADAARVGILLASLLAGLVGAALLRRVPVRG